MHRIYLINVFLQFELSYWNKWTFPWHSNWLRCTCISFSAASRLNSGRPLVQTLPLCETGRYVTYKQNLILLVRIRPLWFRLAHGRMMKVCEQVTVVRWWNNIQQHLRQLSSLSKSQVNVREQQQSGFTDVSFVFSWTDPPARDHSLRSENAVLFMK